MCISSHAGIHMATESLNIPCFAIVFIYDCYVGLNAMLVPDWVNNTLVLVSSLTKWATSSPKLTPKLTPSWLKLAPRQPIGCLQKAFRPPKAAQRPPKKCPGPNQGVQGSTDEASGMHQGCTKESLGRHHVASRNQIAVYLM